MAENPVQIAEAAPEKRLIDYRPPAFLVDTVDLIFDLDPEATSVRATMSIRRNPAHGDAAAPLVLDGEDLTLNAVMLDGAALDAEAYGLTAHGLTIPDLPDEFTLDTDVTIAPARNTELSGLYVSGGDFLPSARRRASAASPSFPTGRT
ncbi:hypothetical protein [Acidiphilium iwatense]